jgi:hypothetical protein
VVRNWRIFEAATDTNMKLLESSKETCCVFVGNIHGTYQPRMAHPSLSKENAISNEKLDCSSGGVRLGHYLAIVQDPDDR